MWQCTRTRVRKQSVCPCSLKRPNALSDFYEKYAYTQSHNSMVQKKNPNEVGSNNVTQIKSVSQSQF